MLISVLMCTMFGSFTYSQKVILSSEQAEHLLRKGKTQKVTGIILSSAGVVGLIVGISLFEVPSLGTLMDNVKATCVTAAGVGACIVGIVNITSGNKKIKKANLFLSNEHLGIAPKFKSKEVLVSVGVRLNL